MNTTDMIALLLLALSIACYSVSQLQQHGKLKGQKDDMSFWGEKSNLRKYKFLHGAIMLTDGDWSWKKYYYKLLGLKYRERWFTSTWLTVSATDSYHLLQSLSFLSMAGCVSLLSGINFFIVWLGVIFVHALTYKLLSK